MVGVLTSLADAGGPGSLTLVRSLRQHEQFFGSTEILENEIGPSRSISSKNRQIGAILAIFKTFKDLQGLHDKHGNSKSLFFGELS